jgi:hypothetical protein
MKRFFLLCFFAVITGGSVLTVSETARAAIRTDCNNVKTFIKKYWGPHKKLDHKPSQATLKAWKKWREDKLKEFDWACRMIEPKLTLNDGFLEPAPMSPPVFKFSMGNLSPEPEDLINLLAFQPTSELPLYDHPTPISDTGISTNPYFPGWFSGGGWLGSTGKPTEPGCEKNNPDCTNNGGNPPPPPIQPVPEPNYGPVGLGILLIGGLLVLKR